MAEKLSTDLFPRLDSFRLHKANALVGGATTKWVWPLPIGTTTVVARVDDADRLWLSVSDGPEVSYAINRMAGTLGNTYPFFLCGCGKSVRYLYINSLSQRAACRICERLSYPAEMPRQWNVAQRRLARARAKVAQIEADMVSARRRRDLSELRQRHERQQ